MNYCWQCVALAVPLTPAALVLTEQQRVMLLSRSPSGPKKYFPIPVENLEEEIRIRSADEGKLFREEFNVSFYAWMAENVGQTKRSVGINDSLVHGWCCSVGSVLWGPFLWIKPGIFPHLWC